MIIEMPDKIKELKNNKLLKLGGFTTMKNFGFGCMRLPMEPGANWMNGNVDLEQFTRMVDTFLENGFTYFDTAHSYIGGKSETAIRKCLVERYPRDRYILADKLTESFFQKEEDILPVFADQLEKTGVEYFDYYLMHAMTTGHYKKFTRCNAFEVARKLKSEGKIKHIGISFHDKAAVLETILSEHPEIEVVQIQFNYVDYDDPGVESGAVYEVCRKFGKPVIVMEPLKGGGLANLPVEANKVFDSLNGGSCASYANRYAAGFEGVMMVLSGMSAYEQLEDNISYMNDFVPLTRAELDAVAKVRDIFKKQELIPCTACRYCTDECPKQIAIPDLLSCMNAKKQYKDWNSDFYYMVHTTNSGKASDCIQCGKCEQFCPQHLDIRKLLDNVVSVFEKR